MKIGSLYLKAINYCKGVVNGDIIANTYVTKQCKAILDDIEEIRNNPNSKYVLDMQNIGFIEECLKVFKFSTGDEDIVGKPILSNILGFQALILVAFFGFKHRANTDKRRYITTNIFIARKNGKTFLVGLICLILLRVEPKFSQFFSISVKHDSSRLIYDEMKKTIQASGIGRHFKITEDEILCRTTESFFVPLSKNVKDGGKPSVFVADEVGDFDTDDSINAMEGGMRHTGVNKSKFFITTAYPKESTVWRDRVDYAKKILDGKVKDDTVFSLLYYAENEEEYLTDKAIYEANPMAIDIRSIYDDIATDRDNAIEIPSKMDTYKTKYLNIFLNGGGDNAYLQPRDIEKCLIDNYDFTGKRVIIGVDLANTTDNTGVSILHREKDGTVIVKSMAFIPSTKVKEKSKKEKFNYDRAISNNECISCGDDGHIDHNAVADYIIGLSKGMIIDYVCYDNAQSYQFISRLRDNFTCIPIYQQGKNLNTPVRDFRYNMAHNKVKIVKSELFIRDMLNCAVTYDSDDNMKLEKKLSRSRNGRIDQTVATICGYKYFTNISPYVEQTFKSKIRKRS